MIFLTTAHNKDHPRKIKADEENAKRGGRKKMGLSSAVELRSLVLPMQTANRTQRQIQGDDDNLCHLRSCLLMPISQYNFTFLLPILSLEYLCCKVFEAENSDFWTHLVLRDHKHSMSFQAILQGK